MTAEEREERLAIMIHDGGLSEAGAIAILEQQQGELFSQERG